MSAAAAPNWDAALAVERFEFGTPTAKAAEQHHELDYVRKLPLIQAAGVSTFAARHAGSPFMCNPGLTKFFQMRISGRHQLTVGPSPPLVAMSSPGRLVGSSVVSFCLSAAGGGGRRIWLLSKAARSAGKNQATTVSFSKILKPPRRSRWQKIKGEKEAHFDAVPRAIVCRFTRSLQRPSRY